MVVALGLSVAIFFGLLIHHSFGGGGIYMNDILPVVFTAFGIFKGLALAGIFVGFFVGAAKIISDRSRVDI